MVLVAYSSTYYYVFPNQIYLAVVNFSFIIMMMLLSIQSVLFASEQYRTIGAFIFSMLCGLTIILSFTKLIDILILQSSMILLIEFLLVLILPIGLTFCVFIFCHEQRSIELLSLKEKLKEEVELKNRYLVTFSHELRTPLNAMIGTAQLMKGELLNNALRNDCDIIIESGKSLSNLATSVLDYSSFEAKEGALLNICNVSISETCLSTLALLKPLAQEKKLVLQTNISKQVDDFAELDKNKFRQILINLLGNAIKYTNKGTVTLSLQVIEQSPKKNMLRFSVEDTGIGISDLHQRTLLLPFHQAYKHKNTLGLSNNDGVGFGLSHTSYLLKLMSSQLHFQSTKKKGSQFFFDLALKKALPNKEPIAPTSSHSTKSLNILVVEDIKVNQKILERMLTQAHHTVSVAETGSKALMLLEGNTFDLILLDMVLPDMHGLTLLATINNKNLKSKANIVAVTASVTSEQIANYAKSGIKQVIKKPIIQEELHQVIHQIYMNEKAYVQSFIFTDKDKKPYNKMLFNTSTLLFLQENLTINEFKELIAEAPKCIDEHVNLILLASKNSNNIMFTEELHKLAGYSAQLGLEQLSEAAITLQDTEKKMNRINLENLIKIKDLSVDIFNKENA